MAGVAGAICSLSRADAPIGAGRARDRPPLVRPPGYAPVPATTAFPVIAELVGDERWRERLQEMAPSSAGLAVQATRNLDSLPIGPWPGLGILAAWAGAALLAGAAVFTLRHA